MLKLLTCARGHFWESADEPGSAGASGQPSCPECGAPADSLPLLDLAPAEQAPSLPPPVVPAELALFDADDRPNVAGFEILEDLGRSPTGVRLYRARQQTVNREVLLEVVAARDDPGQRAWGSLRGEAAALGKLSHPGIVQIHEVGERDRQLFYNVTELVDGPTLAQKVADRPLPFLQVVRLMELLARAVDHAHDRGVLHRNLRPSSVLLQPLDVHNDSPLRDDPGGAACQLHSNLFMPRLTGFGLPRRAVEGEAIDSELFDQDIGFLSPEQAWGRTKDLGPNTDVYGLGAVLYFLLTGRAPFRGPSLTDVLDAIQTAELVKPSALRRVPRDLETICCKCLARQPRRRYASAGELADDLVRATRNLPLKARHPSAGERLGRWVRRRPSFAALLVVCFLSTIGMLVAYRVGSRGAAGAATMQRLAEENQRRAQTHVDSLLRQVRSAGRFQDLIRYRQRLDQVAAVGNAQDRRALLDGVRAEERGIEWHYLMAPLTDQPPLTLDRLPTPITAVAFESTAGKLVATVEPNQRAARGSCIVRLWDLSTGSEVHKGIALPEPVQALAFSPDGRRLAVVGGDRSGVLRLFSVEEGPSRGREVLLRTMLNNRFTDLAYSRDGSEVIVAGGNAMVYRYNVVNGQLLQFGQSVWVPLNRSPFTRLAVAQAGTVATTTDGDAVRVYYLNQTWPSAGQIGGSGAIQAIALVDHVQRLPGAPPASPVNLLAVARSDRSIQLHALNSSTPQDSVIGLPHAAVRLAFSSDGQRMAALLADDSVRIWGVAGGSVVELLSVPKAQCPPGKVGLAFNRKGTALLVAGSNKVVVWGERGD
jgi:hypothetical protein